MTLIAEPPVMKKWVKAVISRPWAKLNRIWTVYHSVTMRHDGFEGIWV